MLNTNAIIKKFKTNNKVSTQNIVECIASYPNTEFECKIDINSLNLNVFLTSIISNIKSCNIKIDSIVKRKEFHHFYSKNDIKHRAFIFVHGSKEVWIKEKSRGNIVYTPEHNIPILVRKENKIKPTDLVYNKTFLDTLNWNYQGSFLKECVDISFWFKDFCFTVTVAECNNNLSIFSQIELEYDGCLSTTHKPNKKMILSLFDEVINLMIPKPSIKFSTKVKINWLKSHKNLKII